jgi:hypothetical protein
MFQDRSNMWGICNGCNKWIDLFDKHKKCIKCNKFYCKECKKYIKKIDETKYVCLKCES